MDSFEQVTISSERDSCPPCIRTRYVFSQDRYSRMISNPVQTYWDLIASRHDPNAFTALDAAYREPQRGYHDWSHIGDLLAKLDRFKSVAVRPDLIAAAIFWHDAVYVTRDGDGLLRPDAENVRASAELFERHSRFDPIESAAIHDLVMATANHLTARASTEHYPGFARDLDLFLDLDLSSLGAPWPIFARNLEQLRFEYDWVPEPLFCLGRLQMIDTFAACGDALYRRNETRKLWNQRAHENLTRAQDELRRQVARLASSA
jgi:predicted metal-dependent HD superfamily phosphohydrolase